MKKSFVPILLVVFLVGCSTKFSYFFLDWAIEWRVEEYVTLDKSQQKQFDVLLDKFLIWHQKDELLRYSQQLNTLSTAIETQTVTPEMWQQQVTDAKAHWFRIFDFILPDLLPILASLSDEQANGMIEQLKQDNKDLNKKYAGKTQQELLEDSNEKILDRIDDWLGSVSTEQQSLVKKYNKQRIATLDMWLEYRLEWLREFQQAIEMRDDERLLEQRMRLLMTSPDELKSEVYQQHVDQNSRLFGQLVIDINRSLSAKQRQHFTGKMEELITDLSDLSSEIK
ncbi:DUF6279 family lipoprotein [Shewanella sp. 1_MG-2023]|uniref:DUF6279 family lipoprotein n=1 Tax=Shewanella electrodiphila TaxID=934143 RepID=A0ABT0KNR7_9GAMM|nr:MULTISPECIES: DUF6279 family lipoprotein [Shewanella]MCL1045254.1 DUF6279 family lipoprotein [Shewanella electrodiphila]MDO6611896.1 DUF6279 family lipoprotein [Shewanella sp. 7_MG-2023]MDO6771751.1 DUF6279 family lipoprotein [Shewanella sp. 2_MG-2023]MDO6793977.1 DUF6279 family lipoprotein [Shewanella sp. 1_MG-2023]